MLVDSKNTFPAVGLAMASNFSTLDLPSVPKTNSYARGFREQ